MTGHASYPMFLCGKPFYGSISLSVLDKFTNEWLADVALASEKEVEIAIQGAVKARGAMEKLPPPERNAILLHCVDRIEQRHEEFVATLIAEAGKPRMAAEREVQRALDTFRVAAEESLRIGGEVIPMEICSRSIGYRGMTKRVPIGVCSLITPFNFPLNLVAHKIAPAIAAGCPWILKPASWTPITALMLGQILAETELPEGAFSILPSSRETAAPLTIDDRIQYLSFTGSDSVGWELKRLSGRKKVCLELGGNAACLVDETYPIEQAVSAIVSAAFSQAGQSCISIQRLFLHESIIERTLPLLIQQASVLGHGDPRSSSTIVGPLIDTKEADRTIEWIDRARDAGAEVLLEPIRMGNVITPAILSKVPEDQPILCEEAFAPILVIESFSDYEQALDRINASRFGLQAGIFTNDLHRALLAWDKLEVGGVLIGEVPNWRVDHMPYGGVKHSGLGREGVRYAIEDMTEMRLMVIKG